MIDKLSDEQKSDLLMHCMEWVSGEVGDDAIGGLAYATKSDETGLMLWSAPFVVGSPWADYPRLDLYAVDEKGDPVHMALAWRVLNHFAQLARDKIGLREDYKWIDRLIDSHEMITLATEAQRGWLDTCLTLAIEAGLVEAPE